MVLTTGSRSGEELSRKIASARLLTDLGCECASFFGVVLDRDFYKSVLEGDTVAFSRWIDLIAGNLVAGRIDRLIVDGWQLYSVTHDLTHVMGRVAARNASRLLGREIDVCHFEVVPRQLADVPDFGVPSVKIVLSDMEYEAKLTAIRDYPGIETELDTISQIETTSAMRQESIFKPPAMEELVRRPSTAPRYEFYGEQRKMHGIYGDVIRWHHVERIVRDLVAL